MSYEWVDHTSELELAIDADSKEAVFADAVRAWAELQEATGADSVMTLHIRRDGDLAGLLNHFIEALIFEGEEREFVATEALDIELSEDDLWVELRGEERLARPIVKAVTYHRLTFEEQNGRWHATVVLDV